MSEAALPGRRRATRERRPNEESGLGLALAVTLVEALDATTGVDKLLLAGEVRVAFIAQFHAKRSRFGAAGGENVATRAGDAGVYVCGVDFSLHGYSVGSDRNVSVSGK